MNNMKLDARGYAIVGATAIVSAIAMYLMLSLYMDHNQLRERKSSSSLESRTNLDYSSNGNTGIHQTASL